MVALLICQSYVNLGASSSQEGIHRHAQLLDNIVDPVPHLRTVFVFGVLLGISSQTFFRKGLGLGLLLTVFEPLHFSFNSFSCIDQVILVFDVSIANPADAEVQSVSYKMSQRPYVPPVFLPAEIAQGNEILMY